MLRKQNYESLSLKSLYSLRDAIDSYLFKNKPEGEQFHPDYRKGKDAFTKMVYKSVRFRNDLKSFFSKQEQMSSRLVNLFRVSADVNNEDWFNMQYWEAEDKELSVIVEYYISEFFTLGAEGMQNELSYSIGLDSKTPEGKFISKYSLNLAGEINEVTRKRILQQINTGLTLGENREKIAKRLAKTIDNPKRALMIAQTESVRAYSEGRLAVGKRLGAKKKIWYTTYKPCPVCQGLDKKVVGIDKMFKSEFDGKEYNAPPSHPRCRCLVKLVLQDPDEKTTE